MSSIDPLPDSPLPDPPGPSLPNQPRCLIQRHLPTIPIVSRIRTARWLPPPAPASHIRTSAGPSSGCSVLWCTPGRRRSVIAAILLVVQLLFAPNRDELLKSGQKANRWSRRKSAMMWPGMLIVEVLTIVFGLAALRFIAGPAWPRKVACTELASSGAGLAPRAGIHTHRQRPSDPSCQGLPVSPA